MSFKSFIKDKIFLTSLLLFGIATIEIFLIPYPVANFIKLYIPIAILCLYVVGIIIEYFAKRNFYKNFLGTLNDLDEKYLITEIIKKPNFIEGKILKQVLEEINKSMIENVNKYKYNPFIICINIQIYIMNIYCYFFLYQYIFIFLNRLIHNLF